MKASILFITYNHSSFVRSAIRAAMAQDYHSLELIVCDDFSSDDTRAILEVELRNCPKHITVVRAHSEKNVGLIANFNRGIDACTGDIIIPMSGDDISLPYRVTKIASIFTMHPKCMLVISNWAIIDSNGELRNGSCWYPDNNVFRYEHSEKIVNAYAGSPVCGAAASYRSITHKTFGPMLSGKHGEDNCYWVRSLLLGDIHYYKHPLVQWRSHGSSMSNAHENVDNVNTRKKHVKFLKVHEKFYPQWHADVNHAVNQSLVCPLFGQRLLKILRYQIELERLHRYSLTNAPWKLWVGSSVRLLRVYATKESVDPAIQSIPSLRARSRTIRRAFRDIKKKYRLRRHKRYLSKYWFKYFLNRG
jgi:glycosyltransferase involved in cell wall biosynthesis